MKKYLGIICIILVGIALRLINLDKPEGLWNDEYISYLVAITPFSDGFFDILKSQCHMPLYYLYLKFFMFIFGQEDILLRFTSILPGVLSIPIMYLIGKQTNKNTGYTCAIFTAVSSFLIYYSQEVRLYSLLFLLSAITLLYTLKLIKNINKKNIILYCISNFLILITHTIGFVFVFFNLLLISLNTFKNHKKQIITIWTSIGIILVLTLPLIINILSVKFYAQWWGHFSFSKIGFLLTDYFSPIVTNFTNAPDNFFYNPSLLVFMLTPTLIAIIFIINSLRKNKLNIQLLGLCILTITTLAIAAGMGKLVFITKYSIEIYPILIYLAGVGYNSMTNKTLKQTMIWSYLIISLGYLLLAPHSTPKIQRAEGHKIVADILEQMELKKDDIIIIQYYDKDRFAKYFDFSKFKVISINKSNFYEYMSPNTFKEIYKNEKEIYKNILNSLDNPYFEEKLDKQIFKDLKQGQSIAVVMLDSVAFFDMDAIQKISSNENLYKKTPILFLVFSYVKNKIFYDIIKEIPIVGGGQKGSWRIFKFTKLNN